MSPTLTTNVLPRKTRSPILRWRLRRAASAPASEGGAIVAIAGARYPVELVGDTGVPFTVIFETSFKASVAKADGSGA